MKKLLKQSQIFKSKVDKVGFDFITISVPYLYDTRIREPGS